MQHQQGDKHDKQRDTQERLGDVQHARLQFTLGIWIPRSMRRQKACAVWTEMNLPCRHSIPLIANAPSAAFKPIFVTGSYMTHDFNESYWMCLEFMVLRCFE